MAKLNDTSKGILGKASEKIGTFTESTGGGTPLKKGEKLKDHPEAERVSQPRDENGQFTYNSVNGKSLKYGPSRGTTVPPFLRGVELVFCQKGTKLKIEGEDGIEIKIMTIDMSVEQIVENCKEYIESEEGFAGMGEGSSITKMGRKTKEEKEAEAGQIGYVDPKKLSEGAQNKMDAAAQKYAEKNSSREVNPTVGKFKVQTDILNPDGSVTRVAKERYWEFLKNHNIKPNFTIPKPANTPKPANSPSSSNNSSSKIVLDQRLANSNPEAFYSRNRELVDTIVETFNSQLSDSEEKFTKEDVIDAIARGDINDAIFEPEENNVKQENKDEESKAMKIFNLN